MSETNNLQALVNNSALRKTINETINIILEFHNHSEGPLNPQLQTFLEKLVHVCFIIAQARARQAEPEPI